MTGNGGDSAARSYRKQLDGVGAGRWERFGEIALRVRPGAAFEIELAWDKLILSYAVSAVPRSSTPIHVPHHPHSPSPPIINYPSPPTIYYPSPPTIHYPSPPTIHSSSPPTIHYPSPPTINYPYNLFPPQPLALNPTTPPPLYFEPTSIPAPISTLCANPPPPYPLPISSLSPQVHPSPCPPPHLLSLTPGAPIPLDVYRFQPHSAAAPGIPHSAQIPRRLPGIAADFARRGGGADSSARCTKLSWGAMGIFGFGWDPIGVECGPTSRLHLAHISSISRLHLT